MGSNESLDKKKKLSLPGKKTELEKGKTAQDNFQYNAQDMDQEQRVTVNPVHLNHQDIHVHVNGAMGNTGCKISGKCMDKEGNPLKNVELQLFFGHKCGLPVYETQSDAHGNYMIQDVPPGYYILCLEDPKYIKFRSGYIKVLTSHTVDFNIMI